MRLKDLLKVIPEFEPIQIHVIDKNACRIISTDTFFKLKVPAEYWNKRIRFISVDDWNCEITVSIYN